MKANDFIVRFFLDQCVLVCYYVYVSWKRRLRMLNLLSSLGLHFVKSYIKWTIIIWVGIFVLAAAVAEAGEPPVKQSKSEICHATDSKWYERTKNYTSFNNLEECLNSSTNARLPKNYTYTPKKES